MLADGRAADALAVPGRGGRLRRARGGGPAGDRLRRAAAPAPHSRTLTDIARSSEETDGDITRVTVDVPRRRATRARRPSRSSATAGRRRARPGASRRARSPSWTSTVQRLDDVRRQRVRDRQAAGLPRRRGCRSARPPCRCWCSPPASTRSRSTRRSAATPGVAVLSDSPLSRRAGRRCRPSPPRSSSRSCRSGSRSSSPTCATQEVLQPTACPFGYVVQDRIVSPPTWSIVAAADRHRRARRRGLAASPPPRRSRTSRSTSARSSTARCASVSRGRARSWSTGTIAVLPDGTASITVSGPEHG